MMRSLVPNSRPLPGVHQASPAYIYQDPPPISSYVQTAYAQPRCTPVYAPIPPLPPPMASICCCACCCTSVYAATGLGMESGATFECAASLRPVDLMVRSKSTMVAWSYERAEFLGFWVSMASDFSMLLETCKRMRPRSACCGRTMP